MKVLWHVTCDDFVAPGREGSPRACCCGRARSVWLDEQRGILEVDTTGNRDAVRVIGMDNRFLLEALLIGAGREHDAEHRDLHAAEIARVEPHYLFHESHRACPFIVIRVGETSDVRWAA